MTPARPPPRTYSASLRPHMAVEYGAALGARAMTTPGDTSTARKQEVDNLVAGAGARADRERGDTWERVSAPVRN
jgi:hypothetical protein